MTDVISSAYAVRGLKRPGAPGGVPNDLPAFAGELARQRAQRDQLLHQGAAPARRAPAQLAHQHHNPLQPASARSTRSARTSGRLGRGDVLFLDTRPEHTPQMGGVHQSFTCMGIDGVNRLLVGAGVNGPRIGECVLRVPKNGSPFEVLDDATGAFTLDVLRRYKPDGIIIDNDRFDERTNGRNDSACFNVAVQGVAECHNGFLYYAQGSEPRFGAPTGPGLPTRAARWSPAASWARRTHSRRTAA